MKNLILIALILVCMSTRAQKQLRPDSLIKVANLYLPHIDRLQRNVLKNWRDTSMRRLYLDSVEYIWKLQIDAIEKIAIFLQGYDSSGRLYNRFRTFKKMISNSIECELRQSKRMRLRSNVFLNWKYHRRIVLYKLSDKKIYQKKSLFLQ